MHILWTYLEDKNWRAEKKYQAALLILSILFAFAGFAVWFIIRIWILSTWDWMVCFIGYPIVISWCVVFLYSFHHDFHDGGAC